MFVVPLQTAGVSITGHSWKHSQQDLQALLTQAVSSRDLSVLRLSKMPTRRLQLRLPILRMAQDGEQEAPSPENGSGLRASCRWLQGVEARCRRRYLAALPGERLSVLLAETCLALRRSKAAAWQGRCLGLDQRTRLHLRSAVPDSPPPDLQLFRSPLLAPPAKCPCGLCLSWLPQLPVSIFAASIACACRSDLCLTNELCLKKGALRRELRANCRLFLFGLSRPT